MCGCDEKISHFSNMKAPWWKCSACCYQKSVVYLLNSLFNKVNIELGCKKTNIWNRLVKLEFDENAMN